LKEKRRRQTQNEKQKQKRTDADNPNTPAALAFPSDVRISHRVVVVVVFGIDLLAPLFLFLLLLPLRKGNEAVVASPRRKDASLPVKRGERTEEHATHLVDAAVVGVMVLPPPNVVISSSSSSSSSRDPWNFFLSRAFVFKRERERRERERKKISKKAKASL
jgi:hypothetical protein